MKTVYVVVAPWDSYSIGTIRVFESREDAEKYKKQYDETCGTNAADASIYVCVIE